MTRIFRFSQTLMHIADLHWVVIEDANATSDAVQRILVRSGIPFTYFSTTTKPGFPKRGWTHRNVGLDFVRQHYALFPHNGVGPSLRSSVASLCLCNWFFFRSQRYIKKVRTIGIWAVGLAGSAIVEAPHVENGTITKWDVVYAPKRRFAVDMAGFAVNLRLILNKNASFNLGCVRLSPESCFLAQFGIPREKVEPFGWNDEPKEILVWHTKTKNIGTRGESHGYVVEL
ncbi:hypothetical protein niasHS_003748 [Heterodera schachtii]|uniref:Galactosylgalactosylxylosylprotein 3-beta-glucuronosyltransferase n=1 Tax=Heterodera schachtii TaxID=97005 RepID=A0ABD2KIR7_HETSC